MKVTTCSTTRSSKAALSVGPIPGGERAITPHPWAASLDKRSDEPGGVLTTESGTTAIRRPRTSPLKVTSGPGQCPTELLELGLLVVVEEIPAGPDPPALRPRRGRRLHPRT